MFNLLLSLFVGILIGWSFHSFFTELGEPNIIKNDINFSTNIEESPQKIIHKPLAEKTLNEPMVVAKKVHTINESSINDSFYTLLEEGLFSDAMALYLDAKPKLLPLYRSTIISYFQTTSLKNPKKSIVEMLEYIELEPEHKNVSLQLIELYIKSENHKEAIKHIIERIENASASELDSLHSKLLSTSELYMKLLHDSKNFNELVLFLEERIEYGLFHSFYTYELARYYVELEKYSAAIQLLKEIEFDDTYGEKAKSLLDEISKKISTNQEYTYKLALKKEGEHFMVNVQIDNIPLTLLLDTGATLTMVNEDKISSLTLLQENVILQTAGGEINAQLQEAKSFTIDDVHLENFQIVSSGFEYQNADGLLGMNFFKQFKFKIDQEENVLYLSEKKETTD